MLLRVYRLTDKTGLVLLKLMTVAGDWLAQGSGETVRIIERILGTILAAMMLLVSLILKALKLIVTGTWQVLKTLLSLIGSLLGAIALGGVTVLGILGRTGKKATGKLSTQTLQTVQSGVAATGNTLSRPQQAIPEDPPDVVLGEDPLLIQNRRLSVLVLVLGVLVIGAVLWATDPARTPDAVPVAALPDSSGSRLLVDAATTQPTPADDENAVALLTDNIATPIPTATPPPLSLREGGTLAYVVRERGQTDLWAVPVGSGDAIRITNSPEDERDPAWRKDGMMMAYASRQDGNWEIYTYDLLEDETERITFDLAFQANPRWSHDGLWLAYESYLNDNLDIFAVPVNGSEAPVQITTHPSPDFSPEWSPDGRKVAFVSWRDGNQDIYVIDLDTLEIVNHTGTPGLNEDHPAWSPDGRYLAYSATDAGRAKVFVKPADEPNTPAQVVAFGRTPAWSPLGSSLTFAVDADDNSQTYLYAVLYPRQGSASTEVISVPYGATDPVWSEQPLPPQLINRGGLPLTVDELFIEQFDEYGDPPYRLNSLLDVETERAFLSDRVNDSFNALRQAVQETSGIDYLGQLDDAWWDLERLPEPGEPRRNWHMTGRAFSITRSSILGFPPPIELMREEEGTELYWRVYLRVAEASQDGQLGEPLRGMPWDFLSRSQGDVEAYNQGGRLRNQIPSGYYVDLTQIALDYGWQRFPAGGDWRANSNAINYWMFYKPGGMNWYTAMREIHTAGELINFAPTPTPGAPVVTGEGS